MKFSTGSSSRPDLAVNLGVEIGEGTYEAGTVLGKITADNRYIPSVSTATDGSQNVSAISLEIAVVETGETSRMTAQFSGVIDQTKLKFGVGGTHTAENQFDNFRSVGILIEGLKNG